MSRLFDKINFTAVNTAKLDNSGKMASDNPALLESIV
jgi:hypothetical protein